MDPTFVARPLGTKVPGVTETVGSFRKRAKGISLWAISSTENDNREMRQEKAV